MTIQDDRTAPERAIARWLVIGTDRFLSGWGMASGGTSVAAWACTDEQLCDCERWVRSRSDMLRVRTIYDDGRYRPRPPCVHFHIYLWKGDER